MKEWLRVLPFPILIFSVLTFLDCCADPNEIHWVLNFLKATGLGAIGCVGQYLIHRNILQEDEDNCDGGADCNCGNF